MEAEVEVEEQLFQYFPNSDMILSFASENLDITTTYIHPRILPRREMQLTRIPYPELAVRSLKIYLFHLTINTL
jgi:hypothetical protein